MEFPSPIFSPNYRNTQKTSSYQSPFSSPGGGKPNTDGGSPDFIPFNYSSPLKRGGQRGRGQRKYFNVSSGSFNSSGSSFSPYNRSNNRSGGSEGRNSYSENQGPNISNYYHPSMLEDPWEPLVKHLKPTVSNPLSVNEIEEKNK